MDDRPTSRPETTWGAVRAAIQAATGVAFWLEDHRSIAVFLFAVAAATAVYEAVAWWRVRPVRGRQSTRGARPTRVRHGRPVRSARSGPPRGPAAPAG